MKYVDRGDPVDWDFTLVDIIQDDAWHDLDLSEKGAGGPPIVPPAGASHLAHLIIGVKGTKADNYFYLREKGNVNEINLVCARTQAANVALDIDCLVTMDSARKIQYRANPDDWTTIVMAVRGWVEG